MKYIRQLDSVRAIAVFLVLLWHWIPHTKFINQFPTGPFGVNIFFVLSGFLITQILLKNREESSNNLIRKGPALKNFFIRRALRIFPIYYLTIALTLALQHYLKITVKEEELFSNLTYTTNFYLFKLQSWTDATSHFWSLAVEEQFYLLWPLVMLFVPHRFLLHCIIGFIIIGVISQSFATNKEFGDILPNTCFDSLGMGGLLAWIMQYKKEILPKFYKIVSGLALLSTCILILNMVLDLGIRQDRFFQSLLPLWLITYILLNYDNRKPLSRFLSNKLLVGMGKISYGIYLYHVLYLYFGLKMWDNHIYPRLKIFGDEIQPWLFFTVNIAPFLFLCWLSYQFIEKPILRLKNKFA